MESSAFKSPQKQSKIGILLLTLINLGKFAKSAWPMYFIFIVRYNPGTWLLILAFVVLPIVFFAVLALIQYQNFSYFISRDSGKFIIRKGLIHRKEITIERSKIQEVNINQPFIHKLLNIYKLEIDSAGSDKKEVTVNAISYGNAVELKSYLLEQNESWFSAEADQLQAVQIPSKSIEISVKSLVKYSLTANYLRSFTAVIAFGFYIFQNLRDLYRGNTLSVLVVEELSNLDAKSFQALSYLAIGGAVFGIFILGILTSLVVTLLKYYGLKITQREVQLSMEFGLLNSKNAIISSRKVQMITEVQNYFQKKLDVLYLKFSQIAEKENSKDSFHSVPGCSDREKRELLDFIWKIQPKFTIELRPNIRRFAPKALIFVIIPIFIGIFVKNELGIYFPAVFLYAAIVSVFIWFGFRNSRLFYGENFIRTQSGTWDIKNKTIEAEKVQSVCISQFPWQKTTGLGSVKLITAGGTLSFRTANYAALKKLVNFVLYKVESSKNDWK